MRLDLFLKASRIVKRRVLAKQACEAGRVWLNGRLAKPASTVRPGDVVTVEYGGRLLQVEVILTAARAGQLPWREMYRVVSQSVVGGTGGGGETA